MRIEELHYCSVEKDTKDDNKRKDVRRSLDVLSKYALAQDPLLFALRSRATAGRLQFHFEMVLLDLVQDSMVDGLFAYVKHPKRSDPVAAVVCVAGERSLDLHESGVVEPYFQFLSEMYRSHRPATAAAPFRPAHILQMGVSHEFEPDADILFPLVLQRTVQAARALRYTHLLTHAPSPLHGDAARECGFVRASFHRFAAFEWRGERWFERARTAAAEAAESEGCELLVLDLTQAPPQALQTQQQQQQQQSQQPPPQQQQVHAALPQARL